MRPSTSGGREILGPHLHRYECFLHRQLRRHIMVARRRREGSTDRRVTRLLPLSSLRHAQSGLNRRFRTPRLAHQRGQQPGICHTLPTGNNLGAFPARRECEQSSAFNDSPSRAPHPQEEVPHLDAADCRLNRLVRKFVRTQRRLGIDHGSTSNAATTANHASHTVAPSPRYRSITIREGQNSTRSELFRSRRVLQIIVVMLICNLCCKRTLLLSPAWTPLHCKHIRYEESELRECGEMILRFHRGSGKGQLKVSHEKYMHPDHKCGADIKQVNLKKLGMSSSWRYCKNCHISLDDIQVIMGFIKVAKRSRKAM